MAPVAPAPVAPAAFAEPEVAPLAPGGPPAALPLPPPTGVAPAYRPVRRVALPPPVAIEREFEPRRHGPAGGPLSVGIGPTFAWRRDQGYDYVSSQSRPADFNLFATYDVLVPTPSLVVAAGLDYRRLAIFRDAHTYLNQHLLMADLTARLRIAGASWVAPHARVGVGMARDFVRLNDDAGAGSGAVSVDEQDTGFAASFGAGLTLRTPIRTFETRGGKLSSLSFGVLAEAGYTIGQKAEFRASGGERNGIARAPLDLGSLDRSAPYLRLAAVARF